jgi:hypothetical protein
MHQYILIFNYFRNELLKSQTLKVIKYMINSTSSGTLPKKVLQGKWNDGISKRLKKYLLER